MPQADARRLVERRAALVEVVEDVHDVESAERVNVGQLQRRHDGEVPVLGVHLCVGKMRDTSVAFLNCAQR